MQKKSHILENHNKNIFSLKIIAKGTHITIEVVSGVMIIKDKEDLDHLDRKIVKLNAHVTNCLYNALNKNGFDRIMAHKSKKDIWDKLEISYKGTLQV